MATNFFERIAGPPRQVEETATEEANRHQLIERLLTWLMNNWTEDTITARQIRIYGPYPLRNNKRLIADTTQGLVQRGWLIPVEPHQHNIQKWKIGRPIAVARRSRSIEKSALSSV